MASQLAKRRRCTAVRHVGEPQCESQTLRLPEARRQVSGVEEACAVETLGAVARCGGVYPIDSGSAEGDRRRRDR